MTVLTPKLVKEMPPRPLMQRVAVDFDGVLHSYERGWQGGRIYGEPLIGCEAALRKLTTRYELVVFTARHNLDAVRSWLREHRLLHFFHDVTNRKPAAAWYLDDRALRFISWDDALSVLLGAPPE